MKTGLNIRSFRREGYLSDNVASEEDASWLDLLTKYGTDIVACNASKLDFSPKAIADCTANVIKQACEDNADPETCKYVGLATDLANNYSNNKAFRVSI